MSVLSRLVVLFLLAVAPLSLAALIELERPGDVVVAVASQSAEDRGAAVQEGFSRVLVRLSGQRDVVALPALADADAEAYLASYRYEVAAGDNALQLRLSFDSEALIRLLQTRQAPLWGTRRAPVYLWVVSERATLMPRAAADVLLDQAQRRGVPVVLPDSALTGAATEEGVPWVVRDAARRAGAEAVFAVGVRCPGAGRCDAVGGLYRGEEIIPLLVAAGNQNDALREAFDMAIDGLASRLAVVGGDAPVAGVRLQVSGIGSLGRHGEIDRLLAGTPLVTHAQLERVEDDRATWLVVLSAPAERFRHWLVQEGRFSQVSGVLADPGIARIEAEIGGGP